MCARAKFGRGDDTVGNPHRARNLSFRVFRAYPLIEIRYTSLSSNSRKQYISQQYPPPLLKVRAAQGHAWRCNMAELRQKRVRWDGVAQLCAATHCARPCRSGVVLCQGHPRALRTSHQRPAALFSVGQSMSGMSSHIIIYLCGPMVYGIVSHFTTTPSYDAVPCYVML